MRKNFNQKLITDRSEKSVERYLEDIKDSKPLTRDEEAALAKRIQNGDNDAMHELVYANSKYAVTEAKKYQTGNIPFSELLQQANLGAIEAAKRFDPSKDTKFITYLKIWTKQSILQYLSEYSRGLRLPANQVALKSKVRRFKQSYYQSNGEYPSVAEIAMELDVEYDKVHFLERQLKNVVSMDNTLSEDTNTSVSETIANEDSINPMELLLDESLSTDMARIIGKLPAREREIIQMSFGIGCKEKGIDEIADGFGLTRERIRQLKDKAFKRMAYLIKENGMLQEQ